MSYCYALRRLFFLTPKYDQTMIIRDVAYFEGENAHVNHKLDIFLPISNTNEDTESQPNRRIPIVVHIHGGGWTRGSRRNERRGGPTVGRTCAQEGFIGIVVSYRLARISLLSFFTWAFIFGLIIFIIGLALLSWQLIVGYVTFMILAYAYNFFYRVRKEVNVEHMVDDLCRALTYIHNHITEYCPNADRDQIFLSGHSAGAHLISLLVLDKSHLNRHEYPYANIRGAIPMSGIYSLTNPTHNSVNNIQNWIFYSLYASNLIYPQGKNLIQYSPFEFIEMDSILPPILVMSAKYDMGLEVDAKRFVDKLKTCNHEVEYVVVKGTHGSIASDFATNQARQYFFDFIRQHMKY